MSSLADDKWKILNMIETLKEKVDLLEDWRDEINKLTGDYNEMFEAYNQFMDYCRKEFEFLENKKTPV